MKKLGARVWLTFIIVGLVGQLAWTVENMYFNVFLYNTISDDPAHIAAMVAASAAAATVTTLLMGGLSDRVGKRKPFIVGGYLLWGLSVMAFSLISTDNMAAWFPSASAVSLAVAAVIAMDCIMTFFGSTANDAAFNAHVTDVTDASNRGRAESVLAILPLISMLLVFGLLDGLTQQGKWTEFFMIIGGCVTLTGVLALFLVKDPPIEKRTGGFIKEVVYGFRPSVIKGNSGLYITLAAFCVFSIAVQVFLPYLIIYIQNYLGITDYAIVLGVVLILASVISVVCGRFTDKWGKLNTALHAGAVMAEGLTGMYFVRSMAGVMVVGTVMMGAYMVVASVLGAGIRDYTPRDKTGHFQGIRMIFAVLIPMIIGPFIGAGVISGSQTTYMDLGVVKKVPTPAIFIAAAIVLCLAAIPVLILKKREKTEKGGQREKC